MDGSLLHRPDPGLAQGYRTGQYPDLASWEDAQEFIKKLNERGGGHFLLPTEAQWEYACREYACRTINYSENVWEWIEDWYDSKFYASSEATQKNPVCKNSASGYRVLRGVHAADRIRNRPDYRNSDIRFRLVRLAQE